MSTVRFDQAGVASIAKQIGAVQANVQHISSRIKNVNTALTTTSAFSNVFSSGTLSNIHTTSHEAQRISEMMSNLTSAVTKSGVVMATVDKSNWDWKKFIFKMVGSFGIAGALVSYAGQGIFSNKRGAERTADRLKLFNSGANQASKLAKVLQNYKKIARTGCDYSSYKVKTIFGLGPAEKLLNGHSASSFDSFGPRFKNNFSHQDGFFEQFSPKKGASAAFKWMGAGLTLAANAYSNFTDPDNSTGRAIAETVVETGVDLVKDWAIGTAVTAAVLAVSPAAPVVAVVAATAVATNVLEWGFQELTGKDLTESVSDFLIDGSVYVGKKVGEIGKQVFSKGSSVIKAITGA